MDVSCDSGYLCQDSFECVKKPQDCVRAFLNVLHGGTLGGLMTECDGSPVPPSSMSSVPSTKITISAHAEVWKTTRIPVKLSRPLSAIRLKISSMLHL